MPSLHFKECKHESPGCSTEHESGDATESSDYESFIPNDEPAADVAATNEPATNDDDAATNEPATNDAGTNGAPATNGAGTNVEDRNDAATNIGHPGTGDAQCGSSGK